jgi:hypothetical protein
MTLREYSSFVEGRISTIVFYITRNGYRQNYLRRSILGLPFKKGSDNYLGSLQVC